MSATYEKYKEIGKHQVGHFRCHVPEVFPLQSEPYPPDSPPRDHNPTLPL